MCVKDQKRKHEGEKFAKYFSCTDFRRKRGTVFLGHQTGKNKRFNPTFNDSYPKRVEHFPGKNNDIKETFTEEQQWKISKSKWRTRRYIENFNEPTRSVKINLMSKRIFPPLSNIFYLPLPPPTITIFNICMNWFETHFHRPLDSTTILLSGLERACQIIEYKYSVEA